MSQKKISIAQILRPPSICSLCNQYHQNRRAICESCLELFIPLGPACHICAMPLLDDKFLLCGQCIRKKPKFDRVIASYRFEEPLRTLLHEFKYYEGLYLNAFIADLMLNNLPDLHNTQCLIPVPMHPRRLRERGYNQANELTKYLAAHLRLPYELFLCKKIRNTASQAGLDGKQRRQNLRGSFTTKTIRYRHITLVDDLLTTGSTANELAGVLKKQGAAHVDVWCCARATSE
ncbi:ComF family protein [Legionella nagasakiensis]|uniref:ComF family protein n=1 Tax=Legionella nagasakiensis TaxID=535290 RepID=UPI001A93CC30|nr:ComF family protein [Legionella nagasakiensis]